MACIIHHQPYIIFYCFGCIPTHLVLSSSISSEIQSTITNIFYDQPRVCGKQLNHEDIWDQKMSSNQQIMRISSNYKSKFSRWGTLWIGSLDGWVGGWVGTLYIFIYIHICEGLIFQFPSSHVYSRGVSKFIDRTMSVSHYDLECPFFKHVWFGHGSGFYQHY